MHANWNPIASRPGAPIPALGNARMLVRGTKMAAAKTNVGVANGSHKPNVDDFDNKLLGFMVEDE